MEKLFNEASDLKSQLVHGGRSDPALMHKADLLGESASTLEKAIQNLRDAIIGFEMTPVDEVTQEHIDNAIQLQGTAATHIFGIKDMIKRFKMFLP